MLTYPLAFILTLALLITIHEFGHFVIARWSGVRVLRFSVGFGKPLWSWFDKRGTEFALAVIPLGGYVQMLDERDPHQKEKIRPGDISFNQLSVWWRMAIALGGPLANFLLAIVAYWLLAVAGTASLLPMLGKLDESGLARQAGMPDYQEIVAVDGQPVTRWQDALMALARRLGDSGWIRIASRDPGAEAETIVELPVQDWHRGVADPDLLGSLGLTPSQPALIGELLPDGPAARAGLQVWDRVAAIDDQPIEDWDGLVNAIRAAPERPMLWTVARNGLLLQFRVTPTSRADQDGAQIGHVGIRLPTRHVRYGPLDALAVGIAETLEKTALTLDHLKKMVTGLVSVRNLGGPITIAKVAGDSAQAGWRAYIDILALLSISLFVLNLLPIPVLDGGHLLYCLAELVTRRPVPERVQMLSSQVGLALVGGLIALVLVNDILRLL